MGKQVDKNDFWFIENNPITKVGVYPYLGKQISQDCEPDKIYYVLRPKEELFRKETLESLRLIPLIDGHTMIGKDFTAPEDKGLDGTLGDNVSHDTDTIYNDLKIFSNKMKEEIKSGKKELSLGYFCKYDKQPGTYKGQRYDYVQRDISANHLALVDKGRMGADVRVYDSKNIPEGEAFAMDSIDIAIDKDEDIEWITVRGTHVPIKKGATEEQKSKTIEQFFKMKRATNKEDVDVFENEENRKKFEKLNAELHGKKQSSGSKAEPEKKKTIQPKDFKEGDMIHFKDTDKHYAYLGKDKKGMHVFADSEAYTEGRVDATDLWKMGDDYLKKNLENGRITAIENAWEKESDISKQTAKSEKSEPEQAGKKTEKEEREQILEDYLKEEEELQKKINKRTAERRKAGVSISDIYEENRADYEKLWKKRDDALENLAEKYKKRSSSEIAEMKEIVKKAKKDREYLKKHGQSTEGVENLIRDFEGKLSTQNTGNKKKEELTEATTTTKNTSKEEMKIFVANKAFFDDRIKKPQEFKKELNKTFEEIYTDKTGRRYGEKKDRVATFKDIYEEAVKKYLNKDKGTQDSMEYKTIQGEGKMADKKEKVAIDEDKRKLIDEIGGILKEAGLDDELIRTVIGKAEKIAYNKSEAGDDGEEVEEEVIEEENEEKDKKPAKDKCGKDEEGKKVEEKDKEEEEKKKVVKAFAQKEKLGKEVEDALGTFDHSEMTELEIAKYACDKLDLEVEKGQEISAVKGYLKGLAKAPKATFGYKTVAADSGIQTTDAEFEKFVNKGE